MESIVVFIILGLFTWHIFRTIRKNLKRGLNKRWDEIETEADHNHDKKELISPSKNQIDKSLEEIKRLKSTGPSKEKLEDMFNDLFLIPKDFYQLIYDLSINAEFAIKADLSESKNLKARQDAWETFDKLQKACDDFFLGKEYVRNWVIFKTLEKLGIPEEKFNLVITNNFVLGLEEIRNKGWANIAWSFYLADKIESQYGKGSCTQSKMISLQEQFTDKQIKEYLSNLDSNQIKEFKLIK